MAFTKEEAATVKDAVELIKRELTAGEDVTLYKFGAFKAKTAPARKGRNPKTGATVEIPERQVVRFHASKVWTGTM
jgi:nucleoid DNA-binding protein